MKKRPFGNTGLEVSPISFGAWSIGGPAAIGGKQIGWTGVDDAESIDAVRAAIDLGVNLFDTADVYGKGHSERLLGEALSGLRDRVLICSKVGMIDAPPDGNGRFALDFSARHITTSCEKSLERLRTDRLDIYLMHMVSDGYPLTDEARGAFEALRQQGKIRHFGVSAQTPEHGLDQLDKQFGDAMMIEYNLLRRGAEPMLAMAREHGVGIIGRGALEKGLLSGKYAMGHRFDAQDVRTRLDSAHIDRVLTNVAGLADRARIENWTLVGLALHFPLLNPGCSTIAVGMKSRAQVRQNVTAYVESFREQPQQSPRPGDANFDWQAIIAALDA